jgi:hypothetical protein
MKHKSRSAAQIALRRGLVGFAGMVLGCTTLAAVIVLFDDASSMDWLLPTPTNIAAVQRCDTVAGTAPRRACVETVIARVKGRESERRLASNAPASGVTPPSN